MNKFEARVFCPERNTSKGRHRIVERELSLSLVFDSPRWSSPDPRCLGAAEWWFRNHR